MALVAVVVTLLTPNCIKAEQHINILRTDTNYMRAVMGLPEYPVSRRHYACSVFGRKGFLLPLWGFRKRKAHNLFTTPPNLSDWLCIFRGENADLGWHVNTGNSYYGGLQMDLEFQDTYAPKKLKQKYGFSTQPPTGTANEWTWLEQIWVAIRAYSSGRGYYPWPNTAAHCGLI